MLPVLAIAASTPGGWWRPPALLLALLGFAIGTRWMCIHQLQDVENDRLAGVRTLAAAVPEMMVAASCSKNFAVYRERVGCAMILGATPEAADLAKENMKALARANWSMPPDHGAAVVRTVLETPELRADWEAELEAMRARMLELRSALAESLRARTNSDEYDFIARHRGMFSLIGASPEQIEALREEHAIYAIGDSRINIAGLNAGAIEKLTGALVAVGV